MAEEWKYVYKPDTVEHDMFEGLAARKFGDGLTDLENVLFIEEDDRKDYVERYQAYNKSDSFVGITSLTDDNTIVFESTGKVIKGLGKTERGDFIYGLFKDQLVTAKTDDWVGTWCGGAINTSTDTSTSRQLSASDMIKQATLIRLVYRKDENKIYLLSRPNIFSSEETVCGDFYAHDRLGIVLVGGGGGAGGSVMYDPAKNGKKDSIICPGAGGGAGGVLVGILNTEILKVKPNSEYLICLGNGGENGPNCTTEKSHNKSSKIIGMPGLAGGLSFIACKNILKDNLDYKIIAAIGGGEAGCAGNSTLTYSGGAGGNTVNLTELDKNMSLDLKGTSGSFRSYSNGLLVKAGSQLTIKARGFSMSKGEGFAPGGKKDDRTAWGNNNWSIEAFNIKLASATAGRALRYAYKKATYSAPYEGNWTFTKNTLNTNCSDSKIALIAEDSGGYYVSGINVAIEALEDLYITEIYVCNRKQTAGPFFEDRQYNTINFIDSSTTGNKAIEDWVGRTSLDSHVSKYSVSAIIKNNRLMFELPYGKKAEAGRKTQEHPKWIDWDGTYVVFDKDHFGQMQLILNTTEDIIGTKMPLIRFDSTATDTTGEAVGLAWFPIETQAGTAGCGVNASTTDLSAAGYEQDIYFASTSDSSLIKHVSQPSLAGRYDQRVKGTLSIPGGNSYGPGKTVNTPADATTTPELSGGGGACCWDGGGSGTWVPNVKGNGYSGCIAIYADKADNE